MAQSSIVYQIAVPSPLMRLFDYLPNGDETTQNLAPGTRIKIPFGKTKRIGILINTANHSMIDASRLKAITAIIDSEPILPPDILSLACWASDYYHFPLGEILMAILPPLLRSDRSGDDFIPYRYSLAPQGALVNPSYLKRAPRQAQLIQILQASPVGLRRDEIPVELLPTLPILLKKKWVDVGEDIQQRPDALLRDTPPPLNETQQAAVDAVAASLGGFQAFLLDGITGSGKTEIYLALIERVVRAGQQALVLVPEIALTPQLVERFQQRLALPLSVLHSALANTERTTAWINAQRGVTDIVIGTRSAVFTPMPRLGIIIVDEEHDLSYKQQEGFRYSGRDVAVMRAKQLAIPILLGSATPSLESFHNLQAGRYRHLRLPWRAGSASIPRVAVIDLRKQPVVQGLSRTLLDTINEHISREEQVLLFLNRRGYAPVLLCHACNWTAECPHCDARLTYHATSRSLICHYCGSQRAIDALCPQCQSTDLRFFGQGTERVAETLAEKFPHTPIVRIDRDSTRRKGRLQQLLQQVHEEGAAILIGTQMLAKGHHFPRVTLVGVLNVDQGLFGIDFRATERMAQLLVQVAGRAGRGDQPGQVLIQTRYPEHPLLKLLLTQGYHAFVQAALEERREAWLPPFTTLALLRAESRNAKSALDLLIAAKALAEPFPGIDLFGPVPAPMERRAAKFHAQLLVRSGSRKTLQQFLDAWLPQLDTLSQQHRQKWTLDIDPMETL